MDLSGAARPSAWPPRRAFLGCGAAAGPVFVSTFLLLGAARPQYDPLRHPVSSLALGPGGWMQQLNFVLNGVLYLALSAGLARFHVGTTPPRLGPSLIAAAGAGQIAAGLFLTDPVGGYPPGTPAAPQGYSGPEALIHDLAAVPVFIGLPVAALVWGRAFARANRRREARWSVTAAAAMLAGFVLTSAAFAQAPRLKPVGGLLQRLTVTVGMGWLTAVSMDALVTPAARQDSRDRQGDDGSTEDGFRDVPRQLEPLRTLRRAIGWS